MVSQLGTTTLCLQAILFIIKPVNHLSCVGVYLKSVPKSGVARSRAWESCSFAVICNRHECCLQCIPFQIFDDSCVFLFSRWLHVFLWQSVMNELWAECNCTILFWVCEVATALFPELICHCLIHTAFEDACFAREESW
jgi:hypothetical protein